MRGHEGFGDGVGGEERHTAVTHANPPWGCEGEVSAAATRRWACGVVGAASRSAVSGFDDVSYGSHGTVKQAYAVQGKKDKLLWGHSMRARSRMVGIATSPLLH